MALNRRLGVHVNTRRQRWRYFAGLEEARARCSEVFAAAGVVLTIVEFIGGTSYGR
jgi:hypothetical protein